MAPESERAKCPRCGSTERATRHLLEPPGSDFYLGKGIPCENAWHEPTLTCSEVVERLIQEAFRVPSLEVWFDRTKAEAILHSWRERRVQELEEALGVLIKEMSDHREHCNDCGDALKVAEHALKGGGSHGE